MNIGEYNNLFIVPVDYWDFDKEEEVSGVLFTWSLWDNICCPTLGL